MDVTLTPKKQAKILRQIDALRQRAEAAEAEVVQLKAALMKRDTNIEDLLDEVKRLMEENRNYERNAQIRANEYAREVERLRAALGKTLAELQTVQAAAALAGLPPNSWAGFGGMARKVLEAK